MRVIDYVRYIADVIPKDALVVSSHTANTTSCLAVGLGPRSLTGFNMGFATPVGLGLALALPHRRVITLDGDGGVLLLASAIVDLATQAPKNAVVVVADNQSLLDFPSHTARGADLAGMAKAAGIDKASTVNDIGEFKSEFDAALRRNELSYIVAKVESEMMSMPPGTTRPHLWENKFAFARHIEATEGVSIISRKRGMNRERTTVKEEKGGKEAHEKPPSREGRKER